MSRRNIFFMFFLLLLNIAFPACAREYILARAPQRSAVKLSADWQEFVAALSKESGVSITLKLYDDRHNFERDLMNGKPDFSFGNPAYLILANKKYGYVPVVRSGKGLLKSILVVRRDSKIYNLSELQNQKIVFPGKHAFAASLYLRSLLQKQGIAFTPVYVKGHDNVYRNVVSGNFVAGGGVSRTLSSEHEQLQSQLRVLYASSGMKPHPLIAHPRVPNVIFHRVQDAILRMATRPHDRELLKKVKLENPVIADMNRDYAEIRDLALKSYADLLE